MKISEIALAGVLVFGVLFAVGVIDFDSAPSPEPSSEVDLVLLQKEVFLEVAWEVERPDSKLQTLNDVFNCVNDTVARVKKGKQSDALDALRQSVSAKIDAGVPSPLNEQGQKVDVRLDVGKRKVIADILREVANG